MARMTKRRQGGMASREGKLSDLPTMAVDVAKPLVVDPEAAFTSPDKVTPIEKPVRVYADGIYDLFHFGHARSLEQAKKLFPNTYLLVGCCNDENHPEIQGKTVMTEAERYESLRHCKWVDEVIPNAPWVISQEFIEKHQIDYVAHDSLPYADASGAGKDVYEFVKAIGKFKETNRTEGISTSDVIMRILKDYNQYVMRNLARGYTRKDLGVSYVKEKQLRVNMGITKLRQKVKEHQQKLHTVAKTARIVHNEWLENADRWVAGFLEKFEEGCHIMETAIKGRIQERWKPKGLPQELTLSGFLRKVELSTSKFCLLEGFTLDGIAVPTIRGKWLRADVMEYQAKQRFSDPSRELW
ncbi:hypothetical protein HPP92_020497 [Vanilla planifolia]|uniref:choline-phosphate cytidylyltransferase n=1 Tax=Vanilla planifolia TaxID=51239 RepID=A0A835PX03_VANPL|nr:hypothetical protein HPP92_020497 [Vanilla planifolia]